MAKVAETKYYYVTDNSRIPCTFRRAVDARRDDPNFKYLEVVRTSYFYNEDFDQEDTFNNNWGRIDG